MRLVLTAGTRLGPRHLALLAAIGRDRVLARPKPRVVVLSTGSELVEPGQPLGSGQISESNSFMLTAAAHEAGATAFRVGIVPDDPRALLSAIEDQLIRADLVITTGGVSVGAYDVVKEVLGRLGTVKFDKVAMQPGMPQGVGTIGPDTTPILTFPGNPVSAYVSFEVFGRPVLRRMLGAETLHPARGARRLPRAPSPHPRATPVRPRRPVGGGGALRRAPADRPGQPPRPVPGRGQPLIVVPRP